MLLTCSKDTTMKVFLLHSNMERRENAEINLDRSANDITSLSSLDEQHVVAKLKNSLYIFTFKLYTIILILIIINKFKPFGYMEYR